MKFKVPIILVLTLLMWGTTSGQKVKNKHFSLINYNLDISKTLIEELSPLEGFIGKIKTYNDPGNEKLKAVMIHTIYYMLKEILEEQLKIEILPTNTFMRTVKYDDYGYPKSNISEALRKGYSRYFFKIDLHIGSITNKERDENPELFEGVTSPVIFPKIELEITVYNNEGIIPVDKWAGSSTAMYPLPIDEYLLKGFDNTEMVVKPLDEKQQDNLYLVMYRTVHNAIQSYLAK